MLKSIFYLFTFYIFFKKINSIIINVYIRKKSKEFQKFLEFLLKSTEIIWKIRGE